MKDGLFNQNPEYHLGEPIGAYATVMWLKPDGTPEDGTEYSDVYFSFGEYDYEVDEDHDSYGVRDDRIFFYCDGEQALKSYMTAGAEDFQVISYELEYDDRAIEHANLMNELEHNK